MFTFATNFLTHDLIIRDQAVVRVYATDALRRWIEHRVNSVKGDWYENALEGIGYLDTDRAETLIAEIKATILSTPDVLEITDLQYRIVDNNRLVIDVLRFRTKSGAEGGLNGLTVAVG